MTFSRTSRGLSRTLALLAAPRHNPRFPTQPTSQHSSIQSFASCPFFFGSLKIRRIFPFIHSAECLKYDQDKEMMRLKMGKGSSNKKKVSDAMDCSLRRARNYLRALFGFAGSFVCHSRRAYPNTCHLRCMYCDTSPTRHAVLARSSI